MSCEHRVRSNIAWTLFVCIVLLIPLFPQSATATVTWAGVNGVSTAFFETNCTTCHSATPTNGNSSQTPYWTDFTTVKNNLTCIMTRINGGTCGSGSGFMPPTVSSAINHTLLDQWQTDGTLQDAQPTASTNSASTIGKVQVTLNGGVSANGLATDYWFEWGLNDGGNNFTAETAHQATSNTNGGTTPQSVGSLLTGLTCGTDYQYRTAANNADNAPNSPTVGSVGYFSSAACNFPVVTFSGSQVAGVGDTVTIPITLAYDGSTDFTYPITIQYGISGTAGSGDSVLGSNTLALDSTAHTLTISSGTAGYLTLQLNANSNTPANSTVVLNLLSVASGNATLPLPSTFTVVITGNGAATVVPLAVSQANVHSQYVYKNNGVVTVTANLNGVSNQASYDWSATDAQLLNASSTSSDNQFTFDASSVAPGAYLVAVAITDGQVVTHLTTTVWVGQTAPVLSCTPPNDDQNGDGICDALEGYGDFDGDGLPDYLDPTGDPTELNESVSSTGTNLTRLITTTSGLSLALGDAAIAAVGNGDATGARIPETLLSGDPGYTVVSGVYDFRVRGLTDTQTTSQIVIPLERPLASNAVYRKFNAGVWSDFVETGTDVIRSAPSDTNNNNACPPPGSAAYVAGLVAFNDCLELTLTDGGPNDADGEINGVISDPGAVMIPAAATGSGAGVVPTAPPGGAGMIDLWWLVVMTSLLWFRSRFIGKKT